MTPRLPVALAVAVVALQIAYPLTHGVSRDRLTVAIVIVLAATCVAHAAVTRGPRFAAAFLLGTAVAGFTVEVLGEHTGFPFGRYTYGTGLGARLFGVPLVVGLAWTMLAWPSALAARRLADRPAARVLVGTWALASSDLFLDPQLVAAGRWHWADPAPHLPGVDSVPLTNYAGWMLVSLVLSAFVQALLRGARETRPSDDAIGRALYLWLYAGWVVALAAFLDLGAAAAWGALGMGLVAVPLAARVARPRLERMRVRVQGRVRRA